MQSEACYPIRDVSRLTGVNPVTLRAWQRRYGLIKPARTDTGHRMYSDVDVALIRQIVHWLNKGVSISQVKALVTDPLPLTKGSNWKNIRQRLIELGLGLKLDTLNRELREMFSLYPAELLLRNVLQPWLLDLAALDRPDQESIEHSCRELLQGLVCSLLSIETGPIAAVGGVGQVDSMQLALLRYELQALEIRSRNLGQLEPQQLPLIAERLKVDAWVVVLGAGLNESWFKKHVSDWPENTVFVGVVGAIYRNQKWFNLPYAASISDLMRTPGAPSGLVSK